MLKYDLNSDNVLIDLLAKKGMTKKELSQANKKFTTRGSYRATCTYVIETAFLLLSIEFLNLRKVKENLVQTPLVTASVKTSTVNFVLEVYTWEGTTRVKYTHLC